MEPCLHDVSTDGGLMFMAGKPARSGPPGNKNSLQHGLYAYKAMLDGNGLDEKTSLFKALRYLRDKEQEFVSALGGDPSSQERAIIGDSVKNMLYIASLDNYLMQLKSLVRKGKPHPVLSIRTQLSAHLRENLKTLGLKRVAKTLTLHEILTNDDDTPGNGTTDGAAQQ
ncbi:MAG: hypothetical protein WCH75_00595 [Candidatus Binatia bacterium]